MPLSDLEWPSFFASSIPNNAETFLTDSDAIVEVWILLKVSL